MQGSLGLHPLHLIVPKPDRPQSPHSKVSTPENSRVRCGESRQKWQRDRQVLRLTHPIKRPIASRSRSAKIPTNMIEYAQEL